MLIEKLENEKLKTKTLLEKYLINFKNKESDLLKVLSEQMKRCAKYKEKYEI